MPLSLRGTGGEERQRASRCPPPKMRWKVKWTLLWSSGAEVRLPRPQNDITRCVFKRTKVTNPTMYSVHYASTSIICFILIAHYVRILHKIYIYIYYIHIDIIHIHMYIIYIELMTTLDWPFFYDRISTAWYYMNTKLPIWINSMQLLVSNRITTADSLYALVQLNNAYVISTAMAKKATWAYNIMNSWPFL